MARPKNPTASASAPGPADKRRRPVIVMPRKAPAAPPAGETGKRRPASAPEDGPANGPPAPADPESLPPSLQDPRSAPLRERFYNALSLIRAGSSADSAFASQGIGKSRLRRILNRSRRLRALVADAGGFATASAEVAVHSAKPLAWLQAGRKRPATRTAWGPAALEDEPTRRPGIEQAGPANVTNVTAYVLSPALLQNAMLEAQKLGFATPAESASSPAHPTGSDLDRPALPSVGPDRVPPSDLGSSSSGGPAPEPAARLPGGWGAGGYYEQGDRPPAETRPRTIDGAIVRGPDFSSQENQAPPHVAGTPASPDFISAGTEPYDDRRSNERSIEGQVEGPRFVYETPQGRETGKSNPSNQETEQEGSSSYTSKNEVLSSLQKGERASGGERAGEKGQASQNSPHQPARKGPGVPQDASGKEKGPERQVRYHNPLDAAAEDASREAQLLMGLPVKCEECDNGFLRRKETGEYVCDNCQTTGRLAFRVSEEDDVPKSIRERVTGRLGKRTKLPKHANKSDPKRGKKTEE